MAYSRVILEGDQRVVAKIVSHSRRPATIPYIMGHADVPKRSGFETLVVEHRVRVRAFVRSIGVDPDWVDDTGSVRCFDRPGEDEVDKLGKGSE